MKLEVNFWENFLNYIIYIWKNLKDVLKVDYVLIFYMILLMSCKVDRF